MDLNISYSQYVKLFTDNRFYLNLSRRPGNTVIATNFKIGDIIEYGSGERQIPVQPLYKFYSGGSSSVRGWNAQQNGILANTERGGNFLVEGSIELRKKLFPRSQSFTKNIGAALFFDYGNVWEDHKEFEFNEIALAIGFGVRYDLFIGPVRIDLGFKLYDPRDTENKWLFGNFGRIFKDKFAVHFGIGQAF
jgi:outer membrane protein assembly factor BamA